MLSFGLKTIQMKVLIALALLFCASALGNGYLIRSAWIKAGEEKQAAVVRAQAGKIKQFEIATAVNAALAKRAKEDHNDLIADLKEIADDSAEHSARSKKVTRANPLPLGCKPGQARMASVNKTLGEQK